jgi:hypothetical protein
MECPNNGMPKQHGSLEEKEKVLEQEQMISILSKNIQVLDPAYHARVDQHIR